MTLIRRLLQPVYVVITSPSGWRRVTGPVPSLTVPHSSRPLSVSIKKNQLAHSIVHNSQEQKSFKQQVEANAEEYLANLNPEQAKKLNIIKLEVDMLQHIGALVPETFLPSWWVNLLDLETPSARKRYYKYLRKIEKTNISRDLKRSKRAQLREEKEKERDVDRPPRNSIFMQVRKSTMNDFYNSRLAHAMVHGPEVVVDLSYENVMQKRECVNLAEQLQMAISANRQDREPFHLVLTGVSPTNTTMDTLMKDQPGNTLAHGLFTVTDKSYLDLYPRDKLVYLTPNAPRDLLQFNHDDIYIIGGLVDKTHVKPISMAKAKEQNIRMARFPLDRFLLWCKGGKSLTIDQVFKVLLDLKSTGSWKDALKHVPKRKVIELPN